MPGADRQLFTVAPGTMDLDWEFMANRASRATPCPPPPNWRNPRDRRAR
jgi:hypothetical protein